MAQKQWRMAKGDCLLLGACAKFDDEKEEKEEREEKGFMDPDAFLVGVDFRGLFGHGHGDGVTSRIKEPVVNHPLDFDVA